MFEESAEFLLAGVAGSLAIPTVKGRPNWARTQLTPPVAAVDVVQWNPGPRTSVGRSRIGVPNSVLMNLSFRVTLYARNEPELWGLLDMLGQWLASNVTASIAGRRVEVTLLEGQRNNPETAALQETFSFWVAVTLSW